MNNIINDELIKKLFFKERSNRKNLMINRKILKNIPEDIYNFLINRFNDSDSIIETIKRIYYNIEEKPCCPVCGKKLKFIGKPSCMFPTTCSCKCNQNYNKTREKLKETCLNRYGVTNGGGSEQALEKIKQTNLERYGVECSWQAKSVKEHIQKTMVERYGVSVPYKNSKIKEKGIQTCLDRYGVINGGCSEQALEKIKQTNLERYGDEYIFKLDTIKEKIKETNIIRYGAPSPAQNSKVKQKLSKIISSKEVQDKMYNTKKKNNSFHISKDENKLYEILKNKFENTIHNYKSIEYPFSCDFYIPELKLYIEYNGTWTHGGHPFDENNQEDINKLNLWKSKNTKYYNNAINTWTIRDVKKRNMAKQNNLNFIEIWNFQEAIQFIDNL